MRPFPLKQQTIVSFDTTDAQIVRPYKGLHVTDAVTLDTPPLHGLHVTDTVTFDTTGDLSPRRRLALTISYAFSAGDRVKPVRTDSAATLSLERLVL